MLSGKRIIILSPQPWGNIHVSKHHYALELARRNNKVIFLNPLKLNNSGIAIDLMSVSQSPNLQVASVTLPIPSFLRFKWRWLYDFIIDFFSKRIALKMGGFDVAWCFDPNYFHNLKALAPFVIYHPVDPITESFQVNCGRYADVIISVSHEIIKSFKGLPVPQHIINHGISGSFKSLAMRNLAGLEAYTYEKPDRLRFGYVGNLLRKEIDWKIIYSIIEQHPEVEFNFWGPNSVSGSNLAGDTSVETKTKIERLSHYSNVRLHGALPSEELPNVISEMDGFLLIYRFIKGQSDRSNSHKILEFFCTGRTLVSFRVKAYEDINDQLLVMPPDDNDELLMPLFKNVVDNISYYNNVTHVRKRLSFALDATYEKNVNKIERIIFSK